MRTIVFGDIHGCLFEFSMLLTKLHLQPDDQLFFVGDLVDRGPDSIGVIRLVRLLLEEYPGSVCVAGNHEEKTLRKLEQGIKGRDWVHEITQDDIGFLDSLPLFHRIKHQGSSNDQNSFLIIHGGLYPRFFEQYDKLPDVSPPNWRERSGKMYKRMKRFLRVRYVSADDGRMLSLGEERRQDPHWSDVYDGREGFAFYGHSPWLNPSEPKKSTHAIGLDTGCCFGGSLTAAVVEGTEIKYVNVPARDVYAKPGIFGWNK